MALIYKNEALREKLAVKAGTTFALNRISDYKKTVYGGQAKSYDELQYLRNTNGDSAANAKTSDAWVKFAPANSSGSTSNRSDQQQHDFLINGSFP